MSPADAVRQVHCLQPGAGGDERLEPTPPDPASPREAHASEAREAPAGTGNDGRGEGGIVERGAGREVEPLERLERAEQA
jgi:hypothetical protein